MKKSRKNKPKKIVGASKKKEDMTDVEILVPEKQIVYVNDIAVEIADDVYAKVMHWVNKADGEISGLGKIELDNGVFRVTSAMLLKQENTAVTTEIDAAAVGKAMFQLRDEPGTLNWWWHSHVDMDVFWSGTDMDTIHEIGAGGWVLATVFNKARESRSCYYQKGTGFIPALIIDEIPLTVASNPNEELVKAWDKEFKDNVKDKPLISRTGYYGPSLWRSRWMDDDHFSESSGSVVDVSETGWREHNSRYGSDFDLEDQYSNEEIQAIVAEEISRQSKKAKGKR